jgi:hypothetical protein
MLADIRGFSSSEAEPKGAWPGGYQQS